MPSDPQDSLLLAAVRDGSESAFRVLYRRHTPRLLQLVTRVVGGVRADAEDVIQETWIAAVGALGGFRGDASFRTWLTGIAINRCRVLLRKRGRWTDVAVDEELVLARPVAAAEQIDLEQALARLPSGYRTVVILHDVEGYTHEEIARLLGVATGTSKAQLFHARRALRALLEPPPRAPRTTPAPSPPEPATRTHAETTDAARC